VDGISVARSSLGAFISFDMFDKSISLENKGSAFQKVSSAKGGMRVSVFLTMPFAEIASSLKEANK
jgi:hypothetical protein